MSSSSPATLRVRSPHDLLAVVPYVLGFHPEESLVLVSVGAAEQQFHARIDLPRGPEAGGQVADYLAAVCARHRLTTVAVVAYTADAVAAEAAVASLRGALRADPPTSKVVVALRADGTSWWALDEDGRAGPGRGTSYDVSSHPLASQAVVEGRVALASRAELAASLRADEREVEAVSEAVSEVLSATVCATVSATVSGLERRRGADGPGTERRWVGARVREFLADGRRLDGADVARLLVALSDRRARDVAWAQMSREVAPRHVDLWRDVVRRSPTELRAAPAGLLGFAAWLAGDGALAWCAIDVCQESDPGYRLAALLTDALAGAVPPSAWQPFDEELALG